MALQPCLGDGPKRGPEIKRPLVAGTCTSAGLYAFQCGVLRWRARLFTTHASLVETHPPCAFDGGRFMRSGGEPLAHGAWPSW